MKVEVEANKDKFEYMYTSLWQAKTEKIPFPVSFRYLKVWALGSGLLSRLLKGLAQRDGLSCSLIKRCEKNTCYEFFPVWQSIY